jgi:ankyrin repeat protein
MTKRYQLACANGDVDKMRKSLTTYDSVDFVNNRGQTGLMIAIEKNQEQTVSVLLNSGANVNAKDSKNWTALHYAAKNGSYVMTEMLLKKKANIYARF